MSDKVIGAEQEQDFTEVVRVRREKLQHLSGSG